jgi:hypothetical protein
VNLAGSRANKKFGMNEASGRICFFCMIALSFCAAARGSQDVILAWDSIADTNVVGYAIYYGTNSGSYVSRLDAGGNNAISVPGLTEGLTYYFVVTAYDAQGEESDPSNEVAYVVPGVLVLTPATNPGDPMRITFPVASSHWYELQATGDLQSWTTIWQTDPIFGNGWLEYDDFAASLYPARFYRLTIH